MGLFVGWIGLPDGALEGLAVGALEGLALGDAEGCLLGEDDGAFVGDVVGGDVPGDTHRLLPPPKLKHTGYSGQQPLLLLHELSAH